MNTISLLVVEDHEAYLQALLNLLIKDEKIRIAGVAKTAEEGLEKLELLKLDLVLVDIRLPRMSGVAFVKLVHDQFPDLPCVMLSSHLSDQYVQRCLQAGARGYLLKDNYSTILEGIWRVMSGEIYLSQKLRDLDYGSLQSRPVDM